VRVTRNLSLTRAEIALPEARDALERRSGSSLLQGLDRPADLIGNDDPLDFVIGRRRLRPNAALKDALPDKAGGHDANRGADFDA
jgi:hypothetical protein